jgi:hypothetical protein
MYSAYNPRLLPSLKSCSSENRELRCSLTWTLVPWIIATPFVDLHTIHANMQDFIFLISQIMINQLELIFFLKLHVQTFGYLNSNPLPLL